MTSRVDLAEVSQVEVEFSLEDHDRTTVLVVHAEGRVRAGQSGIDDCRFLVAMSYAGVAAWRPDEIIWDLRSLHYTSEDNVHEIFNVRSLYGTPGVAIAGPKCRAAILSRPMLGIERLVVDSYDEAVRTLADSRARRELRRARSCRES